MLSNGKSFLSRILPLKNTKAIWKLFDLDIKKTKPPTTMMTMTAFKFVLKVEHEALLV